jgi:hypothetical protein
MNEHPVNEVFREHAGLERTLDAVDREGAFRETAETVFALNRGDLLWRSAGAVAAGAAGYLGLSGGDARAATGMTANDVAILRFDQVLEELQAGLYTEAERLGALKPETLAWARVVGAHERAHPGDQEPARAEGAQELVVQLRRCHL